MPKHRRTSTYLASFLLLLILFASQSKAFGADPRTVLSYSVPHMSGMGGNHVVMMPNGMVGLIVSTAGRPPQTLIELADSIRPFAGPK